MPSSLKTGDMSSPRPTEIDRPPFPPKPKLKVAGELARLQGTMVPYSLSLMTPMPPSIGLMTLSGRYAAVVPLSKITGRAKLVWENWAFPEQSNTDTDDNATVKSVYEPLVDCTGRTTKLPWYLAVSTPPKRIDPVNESGSCQQSSSLTIKLPY